MRYILVFKKFNWARTYAEELGKIETTPQMPPVYPNGSFVFLEQNVRYEVEDIKVIITEDMIKHIHYVK